MLATLRQRNFGLLWFAGLISVVGDWVLIATLPFFLYTLTGSALATSGLLIAYTLPGLLFGSIAGVFVDRWDRRRTMLTANLLRAPLILMLIIVRSPDTIWVVYVVAFLEAAIGTFFGPAENALLPLLVAEGNLTAANALNVMNNNLARLIGPSLGAAVLVVWGLPGVLVLDSMSYAISALLVALIAHTSAHPVPVDAAKPSGVQQHWLVVWREWLAGLRLVRREHLVLSLFVVLGMAAIADGFNSPLLVPFVSEVLGGSPQVFAWLLTAQAISGLVAGLLIGHIGQRIRPKRLIIVSAWVGSVMFLVSYNIPSLPLVLTLATLLGFPAVGFFVSTQTLLQSSVADEYRGRVFGALGTTNALLGLVTLGLSGLLADGLGVRPMLNVVVALWFCTALVAWFALRPSLASKRMLENGIL